MDIATFRTNFTEFTDETKYPDAMLTFWMTVAGVYVSATKWAELYDIGMSLALAHYLVIAGNNASSPGSGTGLINSQSVGDVSAGYDTSSTIEDGAGNWNLTNYGQQFIRMARLVGGCAVQL